ncbi:MAG: hypothetical protein ACKVOB_09265 [Sphingomonas sp.]
MSRFAIWMPLVALLLAGCAGGNAGYPSLLPRPIETRNEAESSPPPAAAEQDPALDGAIAAVERQLADVAVRFVQEQGRVAPAVTRAQGASTGSDAWLEAQSAVAALSGLRARTQASLADAEQLAVARADGRGQPYQPLEALLTTATRQAEAQGKAVDAMAAELAPPTR